MTSAPIIVWFRQDLRRSDNPALMAAYEKGAPIIPVYILDDENAGDYKMGGASRFWLHHSLAKLDTSLNNNLYIAKGKAEDILATLAKQTNAEGVYWNRCYEPWHIKRDAEIKEHLPCATKSFNGSLLWEPWLIKNQQGDPYKVFTPFYKKGCLQHTQPREPLGTPERLTYFDIDRQDDLSLLPDNIRWDKKMQSYWNIGEEAAQIRLSDFLDDGLKGYKEGRNFPDKNNVSRLSPHLHWGEISPHQVWYAAQMRAAQTNWDNDIETFCSELGWREFSYYLLYHFPTLPHDNFNEKFNTFPWSTSHKALTKWQKGQTGYPIIDAAMRELWETGYMHNRARMIVGSFLTKHLRLHWHDGAAWFWDCLVDADLASNSASWQWIAGSGADAQPYFRIFNPILQSQKFDPNGTYIRRYLPELSKLSDRDIHTPWKCDPKTLQKANIELGKTYPHPIVDHSTARTQALEAYKDIK